MSALVVVGGGLAGASAAIGLARAGCEVFLIEREAKAQHKVCGEFLSREALDYLKALDVDVRELGAVEIRRVRLAGSGEFELPFVAMSVTRRRLDEELLCVAETAGVTVLRGCRVEGVEHDSDGWRVQLIHNKGFMADNVFVATGKHDLRGRARPKGKQGNLVAFKMYWKLREEQAAKLAGFVELILYRGGYAGLQMVEDGAANLCCLVERGELQRLGGRWENLLGAMQAQCGLLRERLQGAEALLEKPLAIAAIPYGYVRESSDGLWVLGDQAAVIPSFTGDGMSIALHSGCLAAAMYLEGATAEQFQERLRCSLQPQVGLATMFSRGLVWGPSRRVMTAVVRGWPGVLGAVARQTRIRESALGARAQRPG